MQAVLLDGARQLIEAQHEELIHTGRLNLSVSSYYRILAGKTASLFGVSVELGARSVGASRRQVAAVKEFARYSGLAFQLVDDLLDYTGSVEGFGKKPGTDLRARKITLPVMLLRRDLSATSRGRLDGLLEQGGASDADVSWIQAEMLAHGVSEQVLERVEVHRARAERALAPLPDPDGVAWLMTLSQACVERIR
jgi:octaprenyl-diphosphate synthase